MIGWSSYRSGMLRVMKRLLNTKTPWNTSLPLEPQIVAKRSQAATMLADAIVNGYVTAMGTGGDTLLRASVILSPPGITAFYTGVLSAMTVDNPDYTAIKIAIDTGVVACWAGATLNAATCTPLPGHIGHAPISTVLSPGVMALPPIPLQSPNAEIFVDLMINAMRAHTASIAGLHPAMILPPPAPPYPLPWIGYN